MQGVIGPRERQAMSVAILAKAAGQHAEAALASLDLAMYTQGRAKAWPRVSCGHETKPLCFLRELGIPLEDVP